MTSKQGWCLLMLFAVIWVGCLAALALPEPNPWTFYNGR